jgi:hypothetical protein
MTVTIGGRVTDSVSVSVSISMARLIASVSLTATSSTLQPNSPARIFAVSASRVELMFTPVMPSDRSRISTSVDFRLILPASCWRVTCSSILMTFLCEAISCVETIVDLRPPIGPPKPGRPRKLFWPGRPPPRKLFWPGRPGGPYVFGAPGRAGVALERGS